jgi:alkylation response protein AidB-like acyl-CoA dehydrogenase
MTTPNREPSAEAQDLLVRKYVESQVLAMTGRQETATKPAVEPAPAGLLIPESLGGQGLSPVEAVLGLIEAGRSLAELPLLFASVQSTWALLQADDVLHAGGLLADLATGRRIAALGLDAVPLHQPTAVASGDNWLLNGALAHVIGADLADTLVVVALVDGYGEADVGTGLFVVSAGGPGVTVAIATGLDLTGALSTVTLSSAPGRRIGADYTDAGDSIRNFAAIAACAQLLGVAERCWELGREHAKLGEQLLADARANLEQMQAAVLTAANTMGTTAGAGVVDNNEQDQITSVVKAFCADVGPRTVDALVQVLGEAGLSWESTANLYLARAKTLEVLVGSAAFHRGRLARRLGLSPSP